jgi:hypothetical protein
MENLENRSSFLMYGLLIMHYIPVLISFAILLYLHCVKYFIIVHSFLSIYLTCPPLYFDSQLLNALRWPQCGGIKVNEITLCRI